MSSTDFVSSGLRVLQVETDALEALRPHIGEAFRQACELLLACRGRVVVSGMGKSGHIGNKIA
ncbi:D-arabinose 5-phosphate isomerase, partial [Acinetobacter baumannii]